nr:MAG TPA: hypothetical protein [Caudoviricetes sp.]
MHTQKNQSEYSSNGLRAITSLKSFRKAQE